MKVALFGGSFDPIHNGHIEPVLDAIKTAELDRVLYCPTARPPHKEGLDMAPALRRYAMVEAALVPWKKLRVSTFELREDGESLTIGTVRHYLESRPEWELSLLLGADAWAEIHTYQRWEELLELVSVLVMTRPGAASAPPAEALRPSAQRAIEQGRVSFVPNRGVAVSSGELRGMLSRGEDPPAGWVPSPVVEFIAKYRLYR